MDQKKPASPEAEPRPAAVSPPPSDPNILPSNQVAVATGAPVSPSQQTPMQTAAASGPIRHPRPLTATELHNQFEREQEALVSAVCRRHDMPGLSFPR
jgi:hypothetical protein